MNSQINALNNFQVRPNLIQTGIEPINGIKTSSPFAQVNSRFDLASIFINTPKAAVPQTETFGMHDEHEQPTGENVSFDASDPASLYSAFEKLADSPSTQDKIKAQELLLKFQELMQLQIQKASVLHDIASSAIKALRG